MKRKLMISAGVIALLLGTMMVLPALGKHHQRNAAAMSTGANFATNPWTKDEVYGLRMGVALAVMGAAGGIYAFKARKPQRLHV